MAGTIQFASSLQVSCSCVFSLGWSPCDAGCTLRDAGRTCACVAAMLRKCWHAKMCVQAPSMRPFCCRVHVHQTHATHVTHILGGQKDSVCLFPQHLHATSQAPLTYQHSRVCVPMFSLCRSIGVPSMAVCVCVFRLMHRHRSSLITEIDK